MTYRLGKFLSFLLTLALALVIPHSGFPTEMQGMRAYAATSKIIAKEQAYYIGDSIEVSTQTQIWVRFDDDNSYTDYTGKLISGGTVTTPTYDKRCSQWKFSNIWSYQYGDGWTGNTLRITGTADLQPVGFKCVGGTGTQSDPFTFESIYSVANVTLNLSSLILSIGSTETLTATISPDNATDKTVTWTSDNIAVATVSDTGVVTAVAPGTAIITVTAINGTDNTNDDKTATCSVTVNKDISSVTKTPTAKTLTYNGSAQELVTAGVASGGTMYYALGTNATTAPDESAYTTSIPTATEVGVYYVWYKAAGDDNHSDTAAKCIQVTITLDSYKITYSGLENSTGAENNPTSYTMKTDTFTLNNPAKSGYTFAGWTGSNGTTPATTITITKGSTGNRNYTANWLTEVAIPVLTCSQPNISVKKGGTIASLTVRANVTPQTWLTDGELPEELNYRTDGNKFVIIGTISANAETRNYIYKVWARNSAGTSEPVTITVTITGSGSVTSDYVEVPAGEINEMTNQEVAETFANTTNIVLTGEVTNISETIAKLEALTDVKTLDLSLVTGVSELKLENTTLESITLEGNQSVKEVEITGNSTLTTLNLGGSRVEFVDVKGCENLEEINLEGCASLDYLDVSETPITTLNTQDCENLGTLLCASCDISDLKIDGCEKLEMLDCSNNSLPRLDLSAFNKLNELECRNQNISGWLNSRQFNILDILFLRILNVSAAAETEADTGDVANVKDIKAYDESGDEISVTYDDETGEVTLSEVPAKIKYNYITGFNAQLMDVTVSNEGGSDDDDDDDDDFESSRFGGSGCNTNFGFGIMSLVFICLYGFFICKNKIKIKEQIIVE